MAEIKSTLDLVMERTKNMTLSEEEKKEQQAGEFVKKLNGLIQKYTDGILSLEHFGRDFEKLDAGGLNRREMLAGELSGKIGLEKDNDALFDLLERFCGTDVKKIAGILDDYGHAFETARQKRIKSFGKQLQKSHSIRGSAILPDLDSDEEWQRELAEIQIQFGQKLSKETDGLRKHA